MVQWLRLHLPMQGVWGSILGWGAKVTHALWPKTPNITQIKMVHIKKKKNRRRETPESFPPFSLLTHSEKKSCEDTVNRLLSATQGEIPHQNPAILEPSSWTSGLQSCWKTDFCCLSHSVYAILLRQFKLTQDDSSRKTSGRTQPY